MLYMKRAGRHGSDCIIKGVGSHACDVEPNHTTARKPGPL
jgi:hypothetical protein